MTRDSNKSGIKINWFQRAWARLRQYRRIPVVQELEAIEFDEVDHFEGLPAELLEKILSFVDHERTLLTCRLVNQRWNRIVNSLLEKLHNQRWNSWEPVSHPSARFLFTPLLQQVNSWSQGKRKEGFIPLWFPGANTSRKEYKKIKGNPFPAKSLRIYYDHSGRLMMFSFSKSSTITIPQVFKDFGHCLTSIILDTALISFCELSFILSHTPNLIALTIRYVAMYYVPLHHTFSSRVNKMNKEIQISPQLQNLQILGSLDEGVVNFLLDVLSEHLLTLKIKLGSYSSDIISFSIDLNTRPPMSFNLNSETRPKNLKNLSIYIAVFARDSKEAEKLYEMYCSAAVNLICQFSSSLVNLRLSMEFKSFLGYLRDEGVVLDKLQTLSLAAKEYEMAPYVNWRDVLLKEKAGMLLPNLQSIVFSDLIQNTF